MEIYILMGVIALAVIVINILLDKMIKAHSEQKKKLDEHEDVSNCEYRNDHTKDI